MLRSFDHRVALCCNMLGVVGSGLKLVKFEPTTPNMSQPVATCRNKVAKRTQHVVRNIVGRNMLRAFGHRVAMCCNMLGVVGSRLKMVTFEPTTPKKSQQIATRWPNALNMLRPTMLRHAALACCDRLAGALIYISYLTRVRGTIIN